MSFPAIQPATVLVAGDSQRLRQFTWSVCETTQRAAPVPAFIHLREPADRLQSANQNAPRLSFMVSYNIQALMHTIDKVDVGAAWRTEQNSRAFRLSARGMRREIIFPSRFSLTTCRSIPAN